MSDEGEKYDAFISYAWGENRRHQPLVTQLRQTLQAKQLRLFQDVDSLRGVAMLELAMGEGIMNSDFVIFVLTRDYEDRVHIRDRPSNCRYEFNIATLVFGPERFIPIMQDADLIRRWPRRVKPRFLGHFGDVLWLQMTEAGEVNGVADEIKLRIDRVRGNLGSSNPGGFIGKVDDGKLRSPFEEGASYFHEQTRGWIFDRVHHWARASSESAFRKPFVIVGDGGMGKTVFLAELSSRGELFNKHRSPINTSSSGGSSSRGGNDGSGGAARRSSRLRSTLARMSERRSSAQRRSLLPWTVDAAHSFDISLGRVMKEERQNAAIALLSIAKQLLFSYQDFGERIFEAEAKYAREQKDPKNLSASEIFEDFLVAPLQRRNRVLQNRGIVVLDGLVPEIHGYSDLLEIIRSKWTQQMPSWLGLVVSCDSRVYIDLCRSSGTVQNKVELLPEHPNQRNDIRVFALHSLQQDNPRAATDADSVVEESGGVFSVASNIVQERRASSGLEQRSFGSAEDAAEAFQGLDGGRDLLLALCVTREPLPLAAAAEILQIADDRDLSAAFTEYSQLFELLRDGLALATDSLRTSLSRSLSRHIKRGHEVLAAYCVANLDSPDGFAAKHVMHHLVEASDREALSRLLCDFEKLHSALFKGNAPLRVWLSDLTSGDASDLLSPAAHEVLDEVLIKDARSLVYDARELRSCVRARLDGNHVLNGGAGQFAAPYSYLEVLGSGTNRGAGRLIGELPREVEGLACNETLVAAAGSFDDGLVHVFDGATGSLVQEKAFDTHVTRIAMTSAEDLACIVGDRRIAVFNARSGISRSEDLYEGSSSQGQITSIAVHNSRLLAGLRGGKCDVWDLSGETFKRELELDERLDRKDVTDVALDGRYLVAATRRRVVVYSAGTTAEFLRQLPVQRFLGNSSCLRVALSGDRIITGGSRGEVHVWSLSGLDDGPVSLLGGNRKVTALCAQGAMLACGSDDRAVRVWNLGNVSEEAAAPQQVFTGHAQKVAAVTIISSARRVVIGYEDGQIREELLDASMGSTGPRRAAALCIALEGLYVVSGHEDGQVCVWDSATGAHVKDLEGLHRLRVKAVALDGRYIVSASLDRSIQVWECRGPAFALLYRLSAGDAVIEHIRLEAGPEPLLVARDQNRRLSRWRLFPDRADAVPRRSLPRPENAGADRDWTESHQWKVSGPHVGRDLAASYSFESDVTAYVPTEEFLYVFTKSGGDLCMLREVPSST